MNLARFDLGNGFVFFAIGTILRGIDTHIAGRLAQFLGYMVGWGLLSALVVYPIKSRRAAKKAAKVAGAETTTKMATPSFSEFRKGRAGVRKS